MPEKKVDYTQMEVYQAARRKITSMQVFWYSVATTLHILSRVVRMASGFLSYPYFERKQVTDIIIAPYTCSEPTSRIHSVHLTTSLPRHS